MESREMRVLIVDDDEAFLESVKILLKKHGGTVWETAMSGAEAVEKVTERDYDLVLLDMWLEFRTKGLDVLKEIRASKPRIGVMMMSAFGEIPDAVEAIQNGALDFLVKNPKTFGSELSLKLNRFQYRALLIADREKLIQAKFEEAKTAKDANKKGKALEILMTAVFNSIDGFTAIPDERNSTEQIDIFITNRSSDEFWRKEKQFFVAECKNWSKKVVGSPVLSRLETNIRNRSGRCSLGFLVSLKLVAKTIKDDMRGLRRESILIVPIDGERLRRLVEASPVERNRLLQDFVREAASS